LNLTKTSPTESREESLIRLYDDFCEDLRNCYWENYNDSEFYEITADVKNLIWQNGGIDYQLFPPTFRWHLCAARLRRGKFHNWDGWEFRSNWSMTFQGFNGFRMKSPKWKGNKVKRLIIASEQGVGDEICYSSAIPELIVRLGHEPLEIQCHPRLVPVFERSFRIKAVPRLVLSEIEGEAVVALADLFMFYRRDKSHFPKKPFLKVDPYRVDYWKSKLQHFPRPWIGLGWKSRHGEVNPKALMIEKGTYINLQYGDRTPGAVDFECDPLIDMDDHLALVSCMDKVVSVTQTLCHEAGAVGVMCEAIKPPKGSGEVDCILWYYGNHVPVGEHTVYGNQIVYDSLEDWRGRN
jgi:hypothetical protein